MPAVAGRIADSKRIYTQGLSLDLYTIF